MKKLLAIALVLILCLSSFVGCAAKEEAAPAEAPAAAPEEAPAEAPAEAIVLKIGHDSADTVPVSVGLFEFERLVEERTNGAVQVEVYNNGILGSASDYVVNCQMGTLEIGAVNQSVLSSFIEDLPAVDIPYVIESYEHADAVFTGEVGEHYAAEVRDVLGLEVLGIWEVGFRNLTNSKRAVNSFEDVAGLRIRTMSNEVHQAFWKGAGADPVPMSWGEAYTAMQQGAIDGQENPLSIIVGNNVYEVNNHLAITEHVYSSQFIVMSSAAWGALTPEQQTIVKEACLEAGVVEREASRQQAQEAIDFLTENGMEITYPDKQAFIDYGAEFRKDYADKYGEVLAMIEAAK